MTTISVLVEVAQQTEEAHGAFAQALGGEDVAEEQARPVLDRIAGLGIELEEGFAPVPMFLPAGRVRGTADRMSSLSEFSSTEVSTDVSSVTIVLAVEVERSRLDELRETDGVTVWPNSPMVLLDRPGCTCGSSAEAAGLATPATADPTVVAPASAVVDEARSRLGVDCRPFRPAATVAEIRELLCVERIWREGYRGQNVAVGIIDEGVNGAVYPVAGGFSRPGAPLPGSAPVTSHGSMCAADVLIAAPWARLYDYPFLGIPNSGGAITMFQAVLNQRRLDGTPQITNSSYGFVGVPSKATFPNHEVHDIDHPVHRKVREVVTSGAACFFAAGNCGADCPSGSCHSSGIGPGTSIHGSNALDEVITVAAVNRFHQRIGYSSQGPGMFHPQKPDLACYSHILANFGPGRPGGTVQPFDSGTSTATPVAAGVGALLVSAKGPIPPQNLRNALVAGAVAAHGPGWSADYGHGIVNAAAAYNAL